jgi:hypothetical protein
MVNLVAAVKAVCIICLLDVTTPKQVPRSFQGRTSIKEVHEVLLFRMIVQVKDSSIYQLHRKIDVTPEEYSLPRIGFKTISETGLLNSMDTFSGALCLAAYY